MHPRRPLPPFLLLACLAAPALAQEQTGQALWEVGAVAFGASQQAYPGAAQRVNRALALPYVLFRGKYLRADGDGAGIRAIKTPTFEFDVGVAGAFGSGANRVAIRRGMPELGTMIEFGPRIKWNLARSDDGARWRLDLPLRAVLDIDDGMRKKGVAIEPELHWERRAREGWSTHASASALIGDRDLNDTFYGVAPQYARADRPAYLAKRGLVALRASAGASRSLTPDWRLFGVVRLDNVSAAANRDSPLVQRKTGATVGMGLRYTFLRSSARAND
jgi:outer membrane protein